MGQTSHGYVGHDFYIIESRVYILKGIFLVFAMPHNIIILKSIKENI